jgi:hypothetical protein
MIHHGDTEARGKQVYEHLTEQVIGDAIDLRASVTPW